MSGPTPLTPPPPPPWILTRPRWTPLLVSLHHLRQPLQADCLWHHPQRAPLHCSGSRLSRQPVLPHHHDQIGRRTWTRSPRRGQSPGSRSHHGVEAIIIFMRRTGIKDQASCLREDPTMAGPLWPGTDCQLVMPVPPWVVDKP